MSDTYVECLVKRKPNILMKFLKILCTLLATVFFFAGMLLWPALIIGVIMAVAAYFIHLNTDIEYEYLYVDKELTIDKVLARSRRKKVASYDLNRMEILAPFKSYHLDSFKNRTAKTADYSSGVEQQPDIRYTMYYDGKLKIILEPNPELVKAVQSIAPRKVFKD